MIWSAAAIVGSTTTRAAVDANCLRSPARRFRALVAISAELKAPRQVVWVRSFDEAIQKDSPAVSNFRIFEQPSHVGRISGKQPFNATVRLLIVAQARKCGAHFKPTAVRHRGIAEDFTEFWGSKGVGTPNQVYRFDQLRNLSTRNDLSQESTVLVTTNTWQKATPLVAAFFGC